MAPSHAATGLLAGVLATAALSPLTPAGPLDYTAAAAIGAGAALLPDIDHPRSTATRSQGPLTAALSWLARRASAAVHHRTRTAADAATDGMHRHLWHTPAAALALGLAAGTAATLSTAALALITWFTTGLAVRGLAQALPRGADRARLTSWPATTLIALAATALLIGSGASPGPLVGAVLALGMIVHVLGDALTRTAVPLAWPFRVGGRRWAMIGPPRALRFRTGTWPEYVIRWTCLIAAPAVGFLLA
ncbi:metal-dependent hydrolase [Nocardiopsis trehalosi]|uniref:metal-dependent hydrolase n=1 Tax=Nocardiopsis trehalosi TaxID=109329 RepID=UPI0008295895|nr:metal-dependent hydrolase [Nocardiopsis trehalosi]